MKATGFSGIAHILGRDRNIRFEGGTYQVDSLSLEEAQIMTQLLEQMQGPIRRTRTPPSASTEDEVTPEEAREAKAKREALAKKLAEEKAAATKEAEAKAAAAEEKKAKEAKAKRLAAKKAAEEKAAAEEQKAKEAEAKRGKGKNKGREIVDEGDVQYDAETGEVVSTPEEIEAEAQAEREAIQAVEAEDEAETEAETEAESKGNGRAQDDDEIPDEIKKARHLRSVIVYLVETKGISDADEIVEWCEANADEIQTVKRIGSKLGDRVTRALQIMSN